MVCWEPNEEIRAWKNLIDGKLLLETTDRTLNFEEMVHQYKELQEIERCFRTLKSSLDIRPVDRRIRAYIFICVMTLQIQRLIRCRLRKAGIARSPERALEVNTKAGVVPGLVKPTAE